MPISFLFLSQITHNTLLWSPEKTSSLKVLAGLFAVDDVEDDSRKNIGEKCNDFITFLLKSIENVFVLR